MRTIRTTALSAITIIAAACGCGYAIAFFVQRKGWAFSLDILQRTNEARSERDRMSSAGVTATSRHREWQSEEAIHLSCLGCFAGARNDLSSSLVLFRNRLHHIVDRSCARDRQLHVLDESLVVFGKSLQRCLGFHLHDLVAAGFQAAQQRW